MIKVLNFIKNKTEEIVSFIPRKTRFHNYKYCTSVHITNDVTDILKRRKFEEVNRRIDLLEKIY